MDAMAVVVLDALAGEQDEALAELLGPVAVAALRRELRRGARAWAAATADRDGPGAFEATTAAAALAALGEHRGPVAFVAPDVPALDATLAADLRGDLADGVAVTFAPTYDGSTFLLATGAVDPELLALAGAGQDALLAAVAAREVAVGMLRPQRRLASVSDARAAAADPGTPLELGVLLAAGLDVRMRRTPALQDGS